MKLIFTIATASLLLFSFGSCKNESNPIDNYEYNKVSKLQKLDTFSRIEIQAPINLDVEYGTTFLMTFEGDSIAYNNIVFAVENDKLVIRSKKDMDYSKSPSVKLVIPTLKEVEIDGAGVVEIKDFKDQSELELAIDGSGVINFGAFEGIEKLDISIDGSGSIESSKEIHSLKEITIEIEGSGNVNTSKTSSSICNVSIEGAGNADVNAKDELEVEIEGVGNVTYSGTPTVTKSISGLGSVNHQ